MRLAGKLGIAALIGVFVLVLGLSTAYYVIEAGSDEALPNPNGYDDLVAAGQALSGKIPDADAASIQELRDFVSAHQAALDLARFGLTKSCRTPFATSESALSRRARGITAARRLAQSFCVAGDLARMENHPDQAAADYLTAIKLGAILTRGGVVIDTLVAFACQTMGYVSLDRMMAMLTTEQCRKSIDGLEEVEAEQEPCAEIMKDEKRMQFSQLMTVDGFKEYLKEVIEAKSLRPGSGFSAKFSRMDADDLQHIIQLKAKLAARAYFLEKGHWPATWSDVVPGYLKEAPKVPFSPSDTNAIDFSFRKPTTSVASP